jgi:transcriptional regulator with XRE-family HTH domain
MPLRIKFVAMKINEKIKSIRKESGLTQDEFAEKLGIKRSLLGAYEEGRAEPNYSTLIALADFAEKSVDQIIRDNYYKPTRSSVIRIPLVPVKAAAGYQKGFPDDDYVRELPQFTLPNLGRGNYRAFEISGDSMLPILPGTIVVGEKVERLSEVKDGLTYVLVSKNEGIVYKRVFNYIQDNGMLCLVSDNTRFKPYSIEPLEIQEIWSAKAYISIEFPGVDVPSKKELKKQFIGA